MKKGYAVLAIAAGAVLLQAPAALALNQETELLLILLEQKGVITKQDANNLESTINEMSGDSKKTAEGKADKDDDDGPSIGKISDRFKLSGEIKVDAARSNLKESETSTSSSDIRLRRVELSADAKIATYVDGHMSFEYEEEGERGGGSEANFEVEDAYITLDGKDTYPFFAQAGKIYVPFGPYLTRPIRTRFVTDSATQVLGETNDSAVMVGFKNKFLKLRGGLYKGNIVEAEQSNDNAHDWVASLEGYLPEFQLTKTTVGLGYVSNLANSRKLSKRIVTVPATAPLTYAQTIQNDVSGANGYFNISYDNRYSFLAEYVGATKDFQAGELDFDDGQALRPRAWSLELGAKLIPKLYGALRYENTNAKVGPGEHFLAEHQYGALLSYSLFDNTTLNLEQIYSQYANDDVMNQTALQLKVEFE